MNNLEITPEKQGEKILLKCKGRLDANRAGHLNDFLDRLVREGHYHISLDMSEIEYLSSAGIRSLVTQYKNLKAINGNFSISTMSENVRQVLSMVGMIDMLSQIPGQSVAADINAEAHELADFYNYRLQLSSINPKANMYVEFYGQPELVAKSGFIEENARILKSEPTHYAIGLGAIGETFKECADRFGEYILVGKNLAYLPADGTNKPDYMMSSGQLVASLTELYGVHFNGNFSHLIRFDPENTITTFGLSKLIEGILKLTGFKKCGFILIAESKGLIGTSLNASPTNGRELFVFPDIKETVNFTTEPKHNRMLVIAVGYFSTEKSEITERFLRPLSPDSEIYIHAHAAVFPYIPLKKTGIDLSETVDYIFNTTELTDVLHLTNDSREITGLGESQFAQGFCWVTPEESMKLI